MAFKINSIPQGDSFALVLVSIADELGIIATDLSGWDFKFVVKSSLDLADGAAEVTITKAAMVVSGGQLSVIVSPASLAIFTVGQASYYALKAKAPSGYIQTLEQGLIVTQTSALQAFSPSPSPATVITTESGAQITTEDGTVIAAG